MTKTIATNEITIYRVAYLLETEEQDYELELWTDNQEEAFSEELLNRRLTEEPEIVEELNAINQNWLQELSHNYVEEHYTTKEENLNSWLKEYSIDEKF